MVELKEKTVEELRKMASRKKIEGRSKMNKAELVKALKKKSNSKKTIKRRKMVGGELSGEEIMSLLNRNYIENPLYFSGYDYRPPNPLDRDIRIVSVNRVNNLHPEIDNIHQNENVMLEIEIQFIQNNRTRKIITHAVQLTMSNDGLVLMVQ